MKHMHDAINSLKYHFDTMHRNTIFLIATTLLISAFSFIFWILVARFYNQKDVGLATAVLSASNLLATASSLIFGTGILRLLPEEKNKAFMINFCFTISGLFAVILAAGFAIGSNFWSPALIFLKENTPFLIVFIMLTLITSISLSQSNVFIAYRSSHFSFFQNLLSGTRLIFLFIFISSGLLGIILSLGIGYALAAIASFLFIRLVQPGFWPLPVFSRRMAGGMLSFSFTNYIADIFRMLPGLLFPIIIVNVARAEESAYFYITWMIASLLYAIPYSSTTSLLSEGANRPDAFNAQMIKSIRFMLVTSIPLIIILVIFGNLLLTLFGTAYAQGAYGLLCILAISSIPLLINEIYVTVCRIDKKIMPVLLTRGSVSVITLIAGYLLLPLIGIVGIGITWLSSNVLVMIFSLIFLMRRRRDSQRKAALPPETRAVLTKGKNGLNP